MSYYFLTTFGTSKIKTNILIPWSCVSKTSTANTSKQPIHILCESLGNCYAGNKETDSIDKIDIVRLFTLLNKTIMIYWFRIDVSLRVLVKI